MRHEPCVDCGNPVVRVCPNGDDLCARADWPCDDCAMVPAMCADCAIRGLCVAALAFIVLGFLVFGGMVLGVLCR